jgi:WD40 repeat protein
VQFYYFYICFTWHSILAPSGFGHCAETDPVGVFRSRVNFLRYRFLAGWETVLAGLLDRTVLLWNAHTGEALTTLTGHDSSVYRVGFLNDGRVVFSADMLGKVIM